MTYFLDHFAAPNKRPSTPAKIATLKDRDDWMRAMMSDSDLNPDARLVVACLVLNIGNGECDRDYLAKELGMTLGDVIRAITHAKESGWLSETHVGKNCSSYFHLGWPEGVPTPSMAAQLIDDCDTLERVLDELKHAGIDELPRAIEEAGAFIQGDFLAITKRFEIAQRSATDDEIAARITVLVQPYPDKGEKRHLRSDVRRCVRNNTIGVLDLAVRKVTQTCKVLPNTGDVLGAIMHACRFIAYMKVLVDQVPQSRQEIGMAQAYAAAHKGEVPAVWLGERLRIIQRKLMEARF